MADFRTRAAARPARCRPHHLTWCTGADAPAPVIITPAPVTRPSLHRRPRLIRLMPHRRPSPHRHRARRPRRARHRRCGSHRRDWQAFTLRAHRPADAVDAAPLAGVAVGVLAPTD
jgi:hypothetical protein